MMVLIGIFHQIFGADELIITNCSSSWNPSLHALPTTASRLRIIPFQSTLFFPQNHATSELITFYKFSNNVRHCKSIYSAPFYVYTAKKFPGMEGTSFSMISTFHYF